MKITVSEIAEEGLDLEVEEKISSELVNIVSPVRALLRVDKETSEVMITGEVDAEVQLECSRCLQDFTLTLKSRVDVVYDPAEAVSRDENYSLSRDELDTGFYRNDTLDVNDLLLEQLLLNIPMKPLCKPDCKGICPLCGKDLNAEQCHCERKEIDPRLKALETLLKKKE